ncbi:MAG: GNAT family N-acyltransferase [Pseudomonadota bacterium]
MTPMLRSTLLEHDALCVRLATREADRLGAQRLRYTVFVEELGGDGALVDHNGRFERDVYDPVCDHLVLVDQARSEAYLDHVVGAYRLMPGERAHLHGFYCASEYDLSVLEQSGRKLLEVGRSCLHRDVRGGIGLFQLWAGLSDYIEARGVEILFGVASFHGTDVARIAHPLALLYHTYLAPPDLRVTARPPHAVGMDLMPKAQIDRRAAAQQIPALLKSYLRLGGFVGEGAWVDRPFNTTDVCLILDVARVDAKARGLYAGHFAHRGA